MIQESKIKRAVDLAISRQQATTSTTVQEFQSNPPAQYFPPQP